MDKGQSQWPAKPGFKMSTVSAASQFYYFLIRESNNVVRKVVASGVLFGLAGVSGQLSPGRGAVSANTFCSTAPGCGNSVGKSFTLSRCLRVYAWLCEADV